MEIYWTFTKNDIWYEDLHLQTKFKMTKTSLQAYSSNNIGRRRNLQSPRGGETSKRNGTHCWWDPGRLFMSSTRVPNLIYLPWQIPMEGRRIHHRNPQWLIHLLKKQNMSNSRNTSPWQYSPSYHYPKRIINLELFMDTIFWREDASAAIMTLNGDPLLFSEFYFLDFLFQQIWQHEQDLEHERQLAQHCIQWILARDSSTPLYEWVIHHIIQSPQSSWHSSPYQSHHLSSSYSYLRPLPVPPPRRRLLTPHIPIRTSPTVTEACRQQWRREFLWEEYPKDPVEGSQENPIMINVSDFENWFDVSIDVGEVMLWFFHMSIASLSFPLACFIVVLWTCFIFYFLISLILVLSLVLSLTPDSAVLPLSPPNLLQIYLSSLTCI